MKLGVPIRLIFGVTLLTLLVLVGSWSRPVSQATGRVQYKAATVSNPGEVQKILDQHAADGWEFVGTVGATPPVIVFKK